MNYATVIASSASASKMITETPFILHNAIAVAHPTIPPPITAILYFFVLMIHTLSLDKIKPRMFLTIILNPNLLNGICE
jgi:hypothetical protein